MSERSKESKEQKKNKKKVLVAESAYNAQNTQFGLVMFLAPFILWILQQNSFNPLMSG